MGRPTPMQAVLTSQATLTTNSEPMRLSLFHADGTPVVLGDYIEADQMPVQADVAAPTQAAITGGEPPTEAEFNALLADHAATRTVVNALLAKLKTAGLMASS